MSRLKSIVRSFLFLSHVLCFICVFTLADALLWMEFFPDALVFTQEIAILFMATHAIFTRIFITDWIVKLVLELIPYDN